MHIHCTVLVLKETTNVLQLKKIRTEILRQSSPKNSQQFNGFELPVTHLSFGSFIWEL